MPTMMLFLAAAVAPVGRQPEPIRPENWITSNDYSSKDVRTSRQGLARVELTIDPQGAPLTCQVLISSGVTDLDAQGCTLLLQRAAFKPALDEVGHATASRFRSFIQWIAWPVEPLEPPIGARADAIVRLESLARSESRIVEVRVVVDTNGTLVSCAPDKPRAAIGLADAA